MIRIKRLLKSFRYAFKGLARVFREEQNIKIQSFAGILVVLVGLFFGVSRADWLILIITISVVILMEILNSAVERVTDLLKPRLDIYVKEIKDIMAAAVMFASLSSVVIGLIIFWPYLF
jgi:diacylglycerol kinase